MSRTIVVGLSVVALVLVGATFAPAQDHLKCYKIKDPHKFSATVDLTSGEFGVENGCEVKIKGALFCTPVTKDVTQTDAPVEVVTGDALTDDRICYKMKCPTSTIPDLPVTDQFGARTLTKFKATMVCTPAVTGIVTTTTTTTSTTLPLPRCCSALGIYCGGPLLPTLCSALGLTPGALGDVCDATTGNCGATEAAGPCCQEVAGRCSAGPGRNSLNCADSGGSFFASAICDATGTCVP